MKKFLILVPLLFLIGCATAPYGCMSGDCTNGYGTFIDSNPYTPYTYTGEHKNGVSHGQGTQTYTDGTKYVGEWKNGERNGQGTFTWSRGDKLVGEFKNGLPNGQGTKTYSDGRIEKGIWNGWDLIVDDIKAEKEEKEKLDTMLAKQETCETLGFKMGTEKNGECVLKLMELETQVAASTQTIINNNTSSDSATVNALAETQRQILIQRQSQALINMGSALINSGKPKINCRQTLTGFSCY